MDLKPRGGGSHFGKMWTSYYTIWSLWPKGGSSDPQTPPGYGPVLYV